MTSLIQSGAQFTKETFGALASAVAAVSDPLIWAKALGVVSQETDWLLGPEVMRAIFAGFAFLWMFVWFHQKRTKYEASLPGRRIWLHQALWYLAVDSKWAETFKMSPEDWEKRVVQELHERLSYGDIDAWGIHRFVSGASDNNRSPIVPEFWKVAEAHDWKIFDEHNPYTWVYARIERRSRSYTKIKVDEAKLRALYPPRGWLSKLLRRTPTDALPAHRDIRVRQDQNLGLVFQETPIDKLLDE